MDNFFNKLDTNMQEMKTEISQIKNRVDTIQAERKGEAIRTKN